MPTDKPRLTVTVDDEMFEMIERFREENGYANRSQALAVLVHIGLQEMEERPADPTPKRPTRKKRKAALK